MKIFGIGLSKTGTSSLTEALKILGYSNSIHNPSKWLHVNNHGELAFEFEKLDSIDSASDIEVAHYYKELDERYPGSKFILTTRKLDSWLKSCKNHFNDALLSSEAERTLHKFVYGSSIFDEQKFRQAYESHFEKVSTYFNGRESDLLILPLESDKKMNLLSDFLDIKVNNFSYPAVNKAFPLPAALKSRLRKFPALVKLRNRLR